MPTVELQLWLNDKILLGPFTCDDAINWRFACLTPLDVDIDVGTRHPSLRTCVALTAGLLDFSDCPKAHIRRFESGKYCGSQLISEWLA